jgi:hypothetical protein
MPGDYQRPRVCPDSHGSVPHADPRAGRPARRDVCGIAGFIAVPRVGRQRTGAGVHGGLALDSHARSDAVCVSLAPLLQDADEVAPPCKLGRVEPSGLLTSWPWRPASPVSMRSLRHRARRGDGFLPLWSTGRCGACCPSCRWSLALRWCVGAACCSARVAWMEALCGAPPGLF